MKSEVGDLENISFSSADQVTRQDGTAMLAIMDSAQA